MGRPGALRDGREGATLTSLIFDQLRVDILTGVLKPDEKLRLEMLKERYQAGSTPIREALNRLTSEGLVRQLDQRGFAVAPVTVEDLLDVTRTRCLLYEVAFREAIAHGDAAWEEGIVLAHHRLSRVSPHLAGETGRLNPEWTRLHKVFHRSLIAAGNPRHLLGIIDSLFDVADRYRFLPFFSEIPPARDVASEHRALMDVTLDRDAPRAIEMIQSHISRTAAYAERFIATERRESGGL